MHVKGSRQEEKHDIIVLPFVTAHPKHQSGEISSAAVIGTAIYTRHGNYEICYGTATREGRRGYSDAMLTSQLNKQLAKDFARGIIITSTSTSSVNDLD